MNLWSWLKYFILSTFFLILLRFDVKFNTIKVHFFFMRGNVILYKLYLVNHAYITNWCSCCFEHFMVFLFQTCIQFHCCSSVLKRAEVKAACCATLQNSGVLSVFFFFFLVWPPNLFVTLWVLCQHQPWQKPESLK